MRSGYGEDGVAPSRKEEGAPSRNRPPPVLFGIAEDFQPPAGPPISFLEGAAVTSLNFPPNGGQRVKPPGKLSIRGEGMGTRRQYDSEFKRAAVDLVQTSGKTMAALEQELGLSKGLLKHWVREAKRSGAEAFPGNGRLKASDEELRRLQRENAILRQERDILKKAVAIFSQAPKSGTDS